MIRKSIKNINPTQPKRRSLAKPRPSPTGTVATCAEWYIPYFGVIPNLIADTFLLKQGPFLHMGILVITGEKKKREAQATLPALLKH